MFMASDAASASRYERMTDFERFNCMAIIGDAESHFLLRPDVPPGRSLFSATALIARRGASAVLHCETLAKSVASLDFAKVLNRFPVGEREGNNVITDLQIAGDIFFEHLPVPAEFHDSAPVDRLQQPHAAEHRCPDGESARVLGALC